MDRKPAEKLLTEIARGMGLAVCAERYGRRALQIAEDFDGYDAWMQINLKNWGPPYPYYVQAWTRMRFAHDEIANADLAALNQLFVLRCREAKAAIIARLKESIARLEAAP